MNDKKMFKFIGSDDLRTPIITDEIESRGYKKAVRSFQNKNPKLKEVAVEWVKNGVELSKEQRLPMGRFKKVGK